LPVSLQLCCYRELDRENQPFIPPAGILFQNP
jgi:hypothetical protein